MKGNVRPYRSRAGFTLVEVLVVIAIIAILASLLLSAVGRVRAAAVRATAVAEMAQLGNAIGAFKAKFNVDYIPGSFTPRATYPANDADGAYLKKVFPRMNGIGPRPASVTAAQWMTGLPNGTVLDANQTLVFFLSGGTVTNFAGFSTDPSKPFTGAGIGAGGIPPFFQFAEAATTKLNSSTGHYRDPWTTPYAYFTFDTSTNSYTGNNPNATALKDATGKFEQPRGFQILSAGPDMIFGSGGAYQSNGSYGSGQHGNDDLANFAQAGTLAQ